MKECCRCGVAKELSLFYKNKRSSDGHAYHCKECHNKTTVQWQQKNPERTSEINKAAQIKRREAKAQTQKVYYAKNKEYYKRKFREYLEKGNVKNSPRRYDSEKARLYRVNNKEKFRYYRYKRKSLLRGSIGDVSMIDYETVLTRFNSSCALTGSKDIHMDHFIPISTGYGYSDNRNIIPLDAKLNLSKQAKNPFEWIKTRDDIDVNKFNEVVRYLANLNGLSLTEYEAHVYNCFD